MPRRSAKAPAPAGPTYATRIIRDATGEATTYDAECACGWASTGWPVKARANDRLDEHTHEHETGDPARELVEFRDAHGMNGPPPAVIGFDDGEA